MPIPFRPIARMLSRTVHPAPQVDLTAAGMFLQSIETHAIDRGVLLTANHFTAPDFHAWWFVILISAIMPVHVHWITSAGWTNSGWLTGFTHWLFPIGAHLLNFTPMPPMPPDPADTERRAMAVRQVLRYGRQHSHPVIGLTPEGGDQPGGVLGDLPPGVGRFIHLLSQACPYILPAGVWKEDGIIKLKFGSPYELEIPGDLSGMQLDAQVGEYVMSHIARLLPERLRGKYQ